MALPHDELLRRIERDLLDSYDEELELEIEDRSPVTPEGHAADAGGGSDKAEHHRLPIETAETAKAHRG